MSITLSNLASLLGSILFLIFLLIFFVWFTWGFFRTPFVPISASALSAMLDLARIRPGERVFDLGCGDGRILIQAERRFGAVGTGYEISIIVWCLAQINRLLRGSKVRIYRQNFFTADLSQADVVFCYLLPEVMRKLEPKLRRELRPSVRIVSATFALPGYQQVAVRTVSGRVSKVLLYRQV